ncbi:MAG: pyridoxal kinase [Spirochaetes bacterium GWB1_48_6]|nr:MAG: pyridoxal kinase [Spirochaetes bacterium GWB1_48_6]
MNILSIQSHVAYGRVGNRSAVFPLERLGFEVWPINTVQFSCHTGMPGWTGTAFGADHVSDLVRGMENLGVLSGCDAVLSGYMGDAETGQAIIRAVNAAKHANPKALYCCDPVMGDFPGGLYVKSGLPEFMAAEAVPRADIVCPNEFEAELLSGIAISSARDAAAAAESIHRLGPRVVVIKSYRSAEGGELGFFVSDGTVMKSATAPVLPFARPPKGSGDLASALFLGYYLRCGDIEESIEETIGALYCVLEATLASGIDNLALVSAQESIATPPRRFRACSV